MGTHTTHSTCQRVWTRETTTAGRRGLRSTDHTRAAGRATRYRPVDSTPLTGTVEVVVCAVVVRAYEHDVNGSVIERPVQGLGRVILKHGYLFFWFRVIYFIVVINIFVFR